MSHMRQAKAEVDKERLGFYERRIDKIHEREDEDTYLAAYYAVSSAMEKNSWSLGRQQAKQAVAAAPQTRMLISSQDVDTKRMLEKLEDDGFVWKPYDKLLPGIPSFMRHLMDHVRENDPPMAADVDQMLSRMSVLEGGRSAAANRDVPDPVLVAPPPRRRERMPRIGRLATMRRGASGGAIQVRRGACRQRRSAVMTNVTALTPAGSGFSVPVPLAGPRRSALLG